MTSRPSFDIVLAGRGGQGVIFLSRVIGEAAMLQGLGVRTTETHGMAMRGGSVLCFVRIGDVLGPLFPRGSASVLMALHPDEALSGSIYLKSAGVMVINTSKLPEQIKYPANSKIITVDAESLAGNEGVPRSFNLALLGAAAVLDGFPIESEGLESVISSKGPKDVRERNLRIFRLGGERSEKAVIQVRSERGERSH